MSWYQWIVLPLTIVSVCLLRRFARRPQRLRNDKFVVDWPWPLRWLVGCVYLVFLGLLAYVQITVGVPTMFWVIVGTFLLPISYLALYLLRSRVEYDDTTITSYSTLGPPRKFPLKNIVYAGDIGPLGHEFQSGDGQTIYVNSYQTGAERLIELLKRQIGAN
jgi:membrane protein implicated in regulation of membrane protease activity